MVVLAAEPAVGARSAASSGDWARAVAGAMTATAVGPLPVGAWQVSPPSIALPRITWWPQPEAAPATQASLALWGWARPDSPMHWPCTGPPAPPPSPPFCRALLQQVLPGPFHCGLAGGRLQDAAASSSPPGAWAGSIGGWSGREKRLVLLQQQGSPERPC